MQTPVSRSPQVWSWLLRTLGSLATAGDQCDTIDGQQGDTSRLTPLLEVEMIPGRTGVQSRFGPSDRILELARPKTSKSVWATTPCEKLSWGNQYLAKHKRDFSAREDHRREEEEEVNFFRKTQHPSCKTSWYENIVRLSTPKTRSRSFQEAGPPHTSQCDNNCPIWHVDPRVKTAAITPRLLQLSSPKLQHPDFQSHRESVASVVSFASRGARISQRLVQLSLPRIKEANICCAFGRPEELIWTVSRAASRATASARVETLATPKQLCAGYVPPREPEWTQTNSRST